MTAGGDEIERVRRCRVAFQRAMRDGTSVTDAAQAVSRERWEDADRRLAQKRCGTSAEPEDAPHELQWWQK